jgi:hypothetical protein
MDEHVVVQLPGRAPSDADAGTKGHIGGRGRGPSRRLLRAISGDAEGGGAPQCGRGEPRLGLGCVADLDANVLQPARLRDLRDLGGEPFLHLQPSRVVGYSTGEFRQEVHEDVICGRREAVLRRVGPWGSLGADTSRGGQQQVAHERAARVLRSAANSRSHGGRDVAEAAAPDRVAFELPTLKRCGREQAPDWGVSGACRVALFGPSRRWDTSRLWPRYDAAAWRSFWISRSRSSSTFPVFGMPRRSSSSDSSTLVISW